MLSGKYMHHIEKRTLMIVSIFISAIGTLLFPSIEYFQDSNIIIGIAISCRFLEGIGNSLAMSAMYAMIPVIYPNSQETKIGQMEASCAIGNIFSPVIGEFFYLYGGIKLPYIVVFAILVLSIFPLRSLPNLRDSGV